MKLSERQRKTLSSVKLNYGQLCNKMTHDSLEKKLNPMAHIQPLDLN
ncbi:hypothetical protein [Providencia alcalifaciens]